VLEIGCGTGELLAAVEPSRGVGVDISGEMLRIGRERHPHLDLRQMPAERLSLQGDPFDYIILSDLVGYSYDIRLTFERLRAVCHAGTRVVLHAHSRLWQPVLAAAEYAGVKSHERAVNWTTVEDIRNLLDLAGFEVLHTREHVLWPGEAPFVADVANRYLAHLPGFRSLCLTNWVVARPSSMQEALGAPRVSVICPCRNESGNVAQIVERLPRMGRQTELIFVEGHSSDDTLERLHAAAAAGNDIKVYVQEGEGKGDAVRLGFSKASGDVLMILDGDLSVDPEDLTQFYDALVSRSGEFINGSRLVYSMERGAMRFVNLIGNKIFALIFSWLFGQPIKDTLCGTKVLWRHDYERLAAGRAYFGTIDPFGDFDLLLGAARLHLKIVEVPIRYRQRTYGSTNIRRWSHGWLLVKMSVRAARKLLFVA
jgi:hypothetical protein